MRERNRGHLIIRLPFSWARTAALAIRRTLVVAVGTPLTSCSNGTLQRASFAADGIGGHSRVFLLAGFGEEGRESLASGQRGPASEYRSMHTVGITCASVTAALTKGTELMHVAVSATDAQFADMLQQAAARSAHLDRPVVVQLGGVTSAKE